jgi:hypothetical protein
MLEPPEPKVASVEKNMDRLREPVGRLRGPGIDTAMPGPLSLGNGEMVLTAHRPGATASCPNRPIRNAELSVSGHHRFASVLPMLRVYSGG